MDTSFQIDFFVLSCSHLFWGKSSISNFGSVISKSTQKWKIVTFQFFSSVDNVRRIKVHDIVTSNNVRIDQSNKFSKGILVSVFNLVRAYERKIGSRLMRCHSNSMFQKSEFRSTQFSSGNTHVIKTAPKSWFSFSKQRTLLPTIAPHESKVKITRINGAESP